ncbi:MAG: S8 family serine peptidase [Pseudomonadota bacterium]
MYTASSTARTWLWSCAIAAFLTACGGGGGGGGGTSPPPVNQAPNAVAGSLDPVSSGDTVELDGSASTDSDGSITAFAWAQSDGPAVEITGVSSALASFTAPDVNVETEFVFNLTVTDDDGATASDSVTVTVEPRVTAELVTVSGRLLPSASQALDGDTNDPFNELLSNDDPDSPQRIDNPTTLGGYVNAPGEGAEGRSLVLGDREDYFAVDMLQGQNLDLLVAEFEDADADLYLFSSDGALVDFSVSTGQRESITVPSSGRYIVNVSIFAGATNYTLTIGSSLTPVSQSYAEVVPGEAILRYRNGPDAAQDIPQTIKRRMRMRQIGGGPRRSRRVRMDLGERDPEIRRNRLGAQAFRRDRFINRQRAELWETLISIKELAQTPGVATAEPNYRVYPQATVNDEAYAFQWHYPLINLPGAWDSTTGSSDVVVAVVDSGILQNHPDLSGQLVDGFDFISNADEAADGDGLDPDPEESVGGGDPSAINFHGSHVAGTIAAAGNNGIGVAGVAFGARVMPLRALTASGGTLFDVNQAVRYAAGLTNDSATLPARPADIVNLSIAGGGFSPSSQALYNELRSRGIAVVASAGNEGSTVPAFPASYANVISVSAVDVQQQITGYSNTGGNIDVAAPGGDGSADLNGDGYPDGVLSTGASDGQFAYTFLSGTSMAAPHVSGVLALMKSLNPDLDADDFDRLLSNGDLTDDLGAAGRDDRYGHGLINARKAVDAALREAGAQSELDPRLAASTQALNFGSTATRLEVILRNAGGGQLLDVELRGVESWLVPSAANVDEDGLGLYNVRVQREELSPGVYEGTLIASSAQNELTIRVLLSITDSQESELGQIYLLLLDPATDEPVDQAIALRDGSTYRFQFPSVPAGSYLIFAGTDLDNDLLICDAGEACGAYLTIDQPLTVVLDQDRDDLDFPIEYLIALPGTAESANENSGRIGGRRVLQRKP